jgi:hypothetical protein
MQSIAIAASDSCRITQPVHYGKQQTVQDNPLDLAMTPSHQQGGCNLGLLRGGTTREVHTSQR